MKLIKKYNKKIYINIKKDNETVEIAQNYTYLGTRICSTGNFTLILAIT